MRFSGETEVGAGMAGEEIEERAAAVGCLPHAEEDERNEAEENSGGYHGEDHYDVCSFEVDGEEQRQATDQEDRCQRYAEGCDEVVPWDAAEDSDEGQQREGHGEHVEHLEELAEEFSRDDLAAGDGGGHEDAECAVVDFFTDGGAQEYDGEYLQGDELEPCDRGCDDHCGS